jgi:steroid 5-alpha reductase family enzyme
MSALAFFWGIRLALHIWWRHRDKKEDPRYAQWRRDWGVWFLPRSYLQVYLLQGLLMVLVGYPFIHASIYPHVALSVFDILGVWLWMVGFAYEAVADYQLQRFTSEPTNQGRILKTGLWKYSRHPNYFGEILQWFGIACMALALPYGYFALLSSLLVTLLLLRVSGVPMLESHLQHKPGYRAYAERTNAILPWHPKTPVLVQQSQER